MRNHFSIFYDYMMDIYRYEKIEEGYITKERKSLIAFAVPCRYSAKSLVQQTGEVAKINSNNKLFCSLNIDIQEGDVVVLTYPKKAKQINLLVGECKEYSTQIHCNVQRQEVI